MTPIRRSWPLTALVALVAILAACTATDPRLEDEPAPRHPDVAPRRGDADSHDLRPARRSARRMSP